MDTIIRSGASLIQHGKANNRVYLMKLAVEDYPQIVNDLDRLARENEYTKIFGKVPEDCGARFLEAGYRVEAEVPGLFNCTKTGLFIAKYFDATRAVPPTGPLREMQSLLGKIPAASGQISLEPGLRFKRPGAADAGSMARLYQSVFRSYPFPIRQPDYLRRAMKADVEYFGVWKEAEPVALSSAEMDLAGENVEMTDFAVRPEFRGRQLALFLLRQMEAAMKSRGLKTAYTIARLNAPGMNITFHKGGYRFGGTLVNNTNICGGLESMNVWYQPL
jgi:putative beta-lysine N-acetyltransferase